MLLVLLLVLGQQSGVPSRGGGGATTTGTAVQPPDLRYAPYAVDVSKRRCQFPIAGAGGWSNNSIQITPSAGSTSNRTTTNRATLSPTAAVSTSGTTASAASFNSNNYPMLGRGTGGASGGFTAWSRWRTTTSNNGSTRYFVGWRSESTTAFTCAAFPQSFDAVWQGCNTADDANLSVCSANDGGTTCVDLGANFPCPRVANANLYDVTFTATPGADAINYYVTNLLTDAETSGTLTQNLPNKWAVMGLTMGVCNGDAGVQQLGYVATCVTQP